ncbi:cytochrome c-type biogenesis protein CcmH [Pacificibacter maritimus]|uniref:Cytochrome c-type biogenesis protein CcmH n=1 Tax=Pacificibacter maritimus TaxID=762213 RepID=A0A3N4UNH6_9RHOB|nr:c-type cytochrome biogenesis protein CcmI [Pacificibacter maritimus]RPE71568.1 cytochrome c-type biogenesis protein CcmH [Pacificibacter maritimus]
MTFWIIVFIIAVLTTAPLVLVLLRARRDDDAMQGDTAVEQKVYKDQLREVDRDLARGLLSVEAAQRARLEISRRILDLDSAALRQTKGKALPLWLAATAGLFVLLGGIGLYAKMGAPNYMDLPLERRLQMAENLRDTRPTQAKAEETAPIEQAFPSADPQHLALLEKLRTALEDRPDDLQGHLILTRNAASVGLYQEAYRVQSRVIELKGLSATAQDYADLADMMILSVGGYVSPEAEQAISKSLSLDADNGTARYYAGLMFVQTGRPDTAFQLWNALLNDSTADDPWVPAIRSQIESLAQAAGIRYTLPPLPAPALKGPTQDDIEAASDMSDEDRDAFVRSMVDQLSARLANQGGAPQEWAQLISALGVLGDTSRARAIWTEAQVLFSTDPDATALIRNAAQSAGVAP